MAFLRTTEAPGPAIPLVGFAIAGALACMVKPVAAQLLVVVPIVVAGQHDLRARWKAYALAWVVVVVTLGAFLLHARGIYLA